MQVVSDLFLPALRVAHTLEVSVTVVSPYLAQAMVLPISEGSITVDRSSVVRSRCEVTSPRGDIFPHAYQDALAPYGAELRVRAGLRYPNEAVETIPVGVFRIEDVSLDAAAGTIKVAGSDRMAQIVDERFTTPYAPTRYSRHVDVIEDLVRAVYPSVGVELVANSSTVGAPIFDEDRAGAIADLAAAIGCDAYFDGAGRFVLAPVPVPEAADFVWEADATETGVLVGASRRLAREGAYNGVVARGRDAAPGGIGVQALVVDDRPDSPTRWGGPFGHVPRFYQSELITTQAQATSAATSMLHGVTGLADVTEATCVPNPALEVGDPVLVHFPDGTESIHLVESFTIPLSVSETMTLRSKRAVELSGARERLRDRREPVLA